MRTLIEVEIASVAGAGRSRNRRYKRKLSNKRNNLVGVKLDDASSVQESNTASMPILRLLSGDINGWSGGTTKIK